MGVVWYYSFKGRYCATCCFKWHSIAYTLMRRTTHSRFCTPLIVTQNSMVKVFNLVMTWLDYYKSQAFNLGWSTNGEQVLFEIFRRKYGRSISWCRWTPIDISFGGKVVIFGGDFRQILHVILKGTRPDIIFASINL